MIRIFTDIAAINPKAWQTLAETSPVTTWFQTETAYHFFERLPDITRPFVVAVERVKENRLTGLITGYYTYDKNPIKQHLTCRSIVIGGPLLSEDITERELQALLKNVAIGTSRVGAIYIETRNFNDYSPWRNTFEKCRFTYQPHLNFHIDTSSEDIVQENLGKSRKRDIRTSLRDGAVIIDNPTDEQLQAWYRILQHLYQTKIKTPLFPYSFFKQLAKHPDGHILLIALNDEIIGGTACVSLNGRCLYEWFVCGKDGEWQSVFPSSLATYAGIQYAVEHHLPRFDMMGAGTPDQAYGVRDFKARFGGKEVEHGRFLHICSPLRYQIGAWGVRMLKRL